MSRRCRLFAKRDATRRPPLLETISLLFRLWCSDSNIPILLNRGIARFRVGGKVQSVTDRSLVPLLARLEIPVRSVQVLCSAPHCARGCRSMLTLRSIASLPRSACHRISDTQIWNVAPSHSGIVTQSTPPVPLQTIEAAGHLKPPLGCGGAEDRRDGGIATRAISTVADLVVAARVVIACRHHHPHPIPSSSGTAEPDQFLDDPVLLLPWQRFVRQDESQKRPIENLGAGASGLRWRPRSFK